MSVAVSDTLTLTLERDALDEALATVTRIVERRNTIPILTHLLVTAGADGVSLTGTDLDLWVSVTLPRRDLGIDGSARFAVPGLAAEIVRKCASGSQIALDVANDAGRVTLRSGRARFALSTLATDDFPVVPQDDATHRFEIGAGALVEALDAVAFAISTEASRYYLNGVHWHVGEGADGPVLCLVATDGHRLSKVEVLAPEGSAGMPGVIVPRKTVQEIMRLCREAAKRDASARIAIALNTNRIRIACGRTVLVSKLIDGTFPDYGRVVPAGNPHAVLIEAEAFAGALERVMAVQGQRGSGVRLSPAGADLTLSTRDTDSGGSAEESLPCAVEGTPPEIGFNGRYLAEILRLAANSTLRLALAEPGSPCLITTEGGPPGRLIVLMPMRV